MLPFDVRILVHILHIIGFSIGFACTVTLLLLSLMMYRPRLLLEMYRYLYYLIIIQGLTIIISAISGVIRLGYSTVLLIPDQRVVFFLKMTTLAIDIVVLVTLFFWVNKTLHKLKMQTDRNKILTSKQFLITVVLIVLNIIFYSLTLILGGTLTIIT